MNGSNEDKVCVGRVRESDGDNLSFHKKPLYIWAKSFADKESQKEENFKSFVTGNALSHALEYVGIFPEAEQSSLHLSAIFEEESQQQTKNRFPNHYESETKNRIQSLNRMFMELKSYFEDHFSQLVAIKPPNSVHIVSACPSCSVQELEKLLLLLLGAAIQGTQMQDSIKKIKRFTTEVQEALIGNIKLMSDSPDVLHIKSWSQFLSLEVEERQKMYEKIIKLIRKLLFDRNQSVQAQLMSDYFAGYMYCGQRKIYEGKSFGTESDFDDTRLNVALRQLKEELHEKTELLQDCREELEITKNRVQELQDELEETQQKLKFCKKARDELDALREGQEKALRLEAELEKMRKKLQEYEQCYERVEILQDENRSLQLQNESLLEQNSFLTIEKESLKLLVSNEPILDVQSKNFDEDSDAMTDLNAGKATPTLDYESDVELLTEPQKSITSPESSKFSESAVSEVPEQRLKIDAETLTVEDDFAQQVPEINNTNKLPPIPEKQVKRRRRRSSLLNVKRTRRTILFPLRSAQKLMPALADIGNSGKYRDVAAEPNVSIKVIKVCHAPSGKRKCCSRTSSRFKSSKRRQQGGKQAHSLDMDNDADEELSISPNGPPNLSDIENCLSPVLGTDSRNGNDSDDFFVCSNRGGKPVEESTSFIERTLFVNGDSNETVPLVHISNGYFNNSLEVPYPTDEIISATKEINKNYLHIGLEENSNCQCQCSNCAAANNQPPPNSHISVNVNSVENYCTHVNLNLNHILQFEGLSRSDFSNQTVNCISKNMQTVNLHSTNEEPSSSEDDDSIWYEYGCV
ncbi:unnamed protein product [Allacma fusca]|uniref:HOOK N-terminal domain-containing protein n=1 Tax=Allacma fusca TaxID=39272 RepID=A0A8J2NY49_9HEXA|nr:unnamed protein product [Allacma fusca]